MPVRLSRGPVRFGRRTCQGGSMPAIVSAAIAAGLDLAAVMPNSPESRRFKKLREIGGQVGADRPCGANDLNGRNRCEPSGTGKDCSGSPIAPHTVSRDPLAKGVTPADAAQSARATTASIRSAGRMRHEHVACATMEQSDRRSGDRKSRGTGLHGIHWSCTHCRAHSHAGHWCLRPIGPSAGVRSCTLGGPPDRRCAALAESDGRVVLPRRPCRVPTDRSAGQQSSSGRMRAPFLKAHWAQTGSSAPGVRASCHDPSVPGMARPARSRPSRLRPICGSDLRSQAGETRRSDARRWTGRRQRADARRPRKASAGAPC